MSETKADLYCLSLGLNKISHFLFYGMACSRVAFLLATLFPFKTAFMLMENWSLHQYISIHSLHHNMRASQVALVIKNPPAKAGDIRDVGLIPVLGRSYGGGHGNPLQDSCLENPMDRGA